MIHARSRGPLVIGLMLCLCLGLADWGLAPGPSYACPQQSPQSPAQSQPTFHAVTTLVEVDAIVRQRDGTAVEDLTLEDFEVLEDGKPQRVEVLYLVVGVQPRAVPGAAGAPLPIPGGTELPPPSQRVFVLVFDSQHIRLGRLLRTKSAAETFLENDVRDGDLAGVVSGGKLLNNSLTSRREELLTAVRGLQGTPEGELLRRELDQWPRMNELEAYRIVDERGEPDKQVTPAVIAAACAERPDECDSRARMVDALVDTKAGQIVSQDGVATRDMLNGLGALCKGLSRLPGRKTVVLFSDGFVADKETAALREVVGLAARAGVVIYALDTRGLDRGSASSDIFTQAAPTAGGIATLLKQQNGFAVQDGMNSLAVDTGGLATRNENDFPRALHEFAEDGRVYYVVGYRPTNPVVGGQFRTITVRVRRPGLTVRARKGYLSASPSPPADSSTASTAASGYRSVPERPPASPAAVPALPSRALDVPVLTLPAAPLWEDNGPRPVDPTTIRLRPVGDGKRELSGLRGSPATADRSAVPDALAPLIAQGWEAYQRGDTKAARAAMAAVAENAAAPPWAHYVLGWSQFAEGAYAEAAAAWERVRRSVPEFEPTYLNLADAYLQLRKSDQALAVVQAAASRWPADVDTANAVGVVQASMGALDDAIATFARALTIAPADAVSHLNFAITNEIRFVRSLERAPADADRDRQQAVRSYQFVAKPGGTFAAQAREGLRRLQPFDASRLEVSKPVVIARLTEALLDGRPWRLSWAPDGSALCVDSAEWGRGATIETALKRESFRLVSVADGRVTTVAGPPGWATAYWAWKSGRQAPWVPALTIAVAPEPSSGFLGMGSQPGDFAAMTGWPAAGRRRVFRLRGEVVGEATDVAFLPGSSFSWSPFAMGALVFADRSGMLVIMDREGRRRSIPDSSPAQLPAWSPNGRRIAFLTYDKGLRLVVVDITQRETS